jgi:hypothetical protein
MISVPANLRLLPRFRQQVEERRQVVAAVDAYAVHRAANSVDQAKFTDVLKSETGHQDSVDMNADYILGRLGSCIATSDMSKPAQQAILVKLLRIYEQRLRNLSFHERTSREKALLHYTLAFVEQQSPAFKTMYLESFADDCVHAYNGPNGMSCANGVIERIYLSLAPACVAAMTTHIPTAKKESYIAILDVIDVKKRAKAYIQEYIEEHKLREGEPSKETIDHAEEVIRSTLLRRFRFAQKDIDDLIASWFRGALQGGRRTRRHHKNKTKNKNKTKIQGTRRQKKR